MTRATSGFKLPTPLSAGFSLLPSQRRGPLASVEQAGTGVGQKRDSKSSCAVPSRTSTGRNAVRMDFRSCMSEPQQQTANLPEAQQTSSPPDPAVSSSPSPPHPPQDPAPHGHMVNGGAAELSPPTGVYRDLPSLAGLWDLNQRMDKRALPSQDKGLCVLLFEILVGPFHPLFPFGHPPRSHTCRQRLPV